jgi:TPR repeat protein
MKYFKKLYLIFILLFLNFTISCTEQVEIIYPSALDLPVKYGSTLKHALNGDDRAQVDIAFAYIEGDGVQVDNNRAIPWLKIAANQNNNEAQLTLGAVYFNAAKNGKGVENYKEAYHWYLIQAKNENKRAQFVIASLYDDGLGVEKNLQKAFEWYKKAANNDHVTSQRNVGSAYLSGWGGIKDEEISFAWFKKAAKNGDEDSMFFIGRFYRDGKVTPKNLVKAYQWMKLSLFLAKQSGSDNAIVDKRKVEFNKLKSNMTKKDIKQAELWIKRKTS